MKTRPRPRLLQAKAPSVAFVVTLVLGAFGCAACAAPYRSVYYIAGGVSPFVRVNGDGALAGHVNILPMEFGDVKGGVGPGWSVAIHALEFDLGGHLALPDDPLADQRFLRLSLGSFGPRLYLLSHFVEGKTPNTLIIPSGNYITVIPVRPKRIFYQVASAGVDMNFSPFSLGVLGPHEERKFYDGFGEAALFANASIPFGYGASLEMRTGYQYAVTSGSALFFRLELAFTGAKPRKPTADDKVQESDTEDAPKE